MNQIHLLQNQDKLFLSKQKEWVDGRDLGSLYKTLHKDEALNQLFEVNTKDFTQRIHVLSCRPQANGLPDINPADLPPPLPKSSDKGEASAKDACDSDQPDSPADHPQAEIADL